MRILHLAHQYIPEYVGGVELYTQWIAEAQIKRGHRVSVFYRRGGQRTGLESREQQGLQVWAVWRGPLTPLRRFRATFYEPAFRTLFEEVLDKARPDIVHVEHLMGHPTVLVQSLQRRSIPYVITLWDFWWRCANAQLLTNYSREICPGPQPHYLNCARCALARLGSLNSPAFAPLLAPLMALRNRRLLRVLLGAAALIAPTPFVELWYSEHSAPRDKMRLLQPGLGQPSALPPRRRETEEQVRFVYVGGLSFQKGIHTLVEAFGGLRGAAELWIVGDETLDPEYMSLLRSLATPRVRFLGRLARPQVWAALVDADVVVVPSLWYETFSFLVSEGFIAGKPVVASRLGPLADRVRDGVDGLLVPPGDVAAWREALQGLVDDRERLARLRAGVRPPLTLDAHLDALEALYAEVL